MLLRIPTACIDSCVEATKSDLKQCQAQLKEARSETIRLSQELQHMRHQADNVGLVYAESETLKQQLALAEVRLGV